MTPPHSIAFHPRSAEPLPSSSAAHGYTAPTTPAEKAFADGSRASPTKTHGRDEVRGAYRAQSIRAIQEANGDVDAFLEEVETKRRQLDEQIHRYVKQKEREFKLFERDARIKYRSAGSARPDSTANTNSPRTSSISSSSAVSATTSPQLTGRALHPAAQTSPASEKPRTARDREADLVGVFTPSYLPLLNNKNGDPQRDPAAIPPSTSAPAAVSPVETLSAPINQALHRANSDPIDDKNAQKERIKLEKRNSSSGSESRNLVSALKSPAAQARLPKRKRVSLIVGDEVVAPSDNVAAYETANELARDLGYGDHSGSADDTSHRLSHSMNGNATSNTGGANNHERHAESGDHSPDSLDDDEETATADSRPKSGIAFALASGKNPTPHPAGPEEPPPKALGEDLFGFDDFGDKDTGAGDLHIENISDVDDGQDVSPLPSPAPAEDIPRPMVIPKSSNLSDRPVTQIRTLSSSSAQPVSPGFSKPSVTLDAMIAFTPDAITPEIEHNVDYGSLTASASFLDRVGSLGESFMERNAQELRKLGRRRSSNSS